jgi:hypothetical protein
VINNGYRRAVIPRLVRAARCASLSTAQRLRWWWSREAAEQRKSLLACGVQCEQHAVTNRDWFNLCFVKEREHVPSNELSRELCSSRGKPRAAHERI